MNPITYSHPLWHWLLLSLPLLILGKILADSSGHRALAAFISPRLRASLTTSTSPIRSWAVFTLQLLALSLAIIAASGPRWGSEDLPQRETGRNLIIAIDTSRSMLADDLAPDRLTRAKLAAQDLLRTLAGDRVGLIVFAGNAYLQAPLTNDHAAVTEAIQAVDTLSVPRGGSEISRALKLATETFEKSPARNHGLILFTDGGDPDPEVEEWSRQTAQKNILVLAVGVGTREGSLIPDPDPNRSGDFIRDRQGNPVRTALEEGVLKQIAATTRGRYLSLTSTTLDSAVVNQVISALAQQEGESIATTKPIERFHYFLIPAVFLLILSILLRPAPKPILGSPFTQKNTMIKAALITLLTSQSLLIAAAPAWISHSFRREAQREPCSGQEGADFDGGLCVYTLPAVKIKPDAANAWLPRATVEKGEKSGLAWVPDWSSESSRLAAKAHRALSQDDPEQAVKLYRQSLEKKPAQKQAAAIHLGIAHATAKLKQFDTAVNAFSETLKLQDPTQQKLAHQGLAHTLYDQGDLALAKQPRTTLRAWADSIRHFNAAIQLDPENSALTENRDFVQQRLDELQEQMQQQQQQQQQQKGDKGDKGEKGEKGEEGDEGDSGQQGDSGQNGKGRDPNSDQAGDEESNEDPDGKGEDEGDGDGDKDGEGKGEDEGTLPEGQISTADGSNPGEGQGQGEQADSSDGERHEDTGFSPNEARSFLRTYADDQKAVQYKRQRQTPVKGKDW